MGLCSSAADRVNLARIGTLPRPEDARPDAGSPLAGAVATSRPPAEDARAKARNGEGFEKPQRRVGQPASSLGPGRPGAPNAASSAAPPAAGRRKNSWIISESEDPSMIEFRGDESPLPFDEGPDDRGRRTSLPTSSKGGDRKQANGDEENSIAEYIESARKIQSQQVDFIRRKRMGTIDTKHNVVFLPRGGTYVMTDAGPIQFGLPPETIKDSMSMGLSLPTHYVLPKERFNLQTGINVAEFEFPAYFNFFILRKTINLITTRDVEPLIRTIFQETLLGPTHVDFPKEFSQECPREAYPDLMEEMKHWRKNPFAPSQDLCVDTLISFTYFENDVAVLSEGVRIVDRGDEYHVLDMNDEEVARVSSYVILTPPMLHSESSLNNVTAASAEEQQQQLQQPQSPQQAQQQKAQPAGSASLEGPSLSPVSGVSSDGGPPPMVMSDDDSSLGAMECFVPPTFGITMLGNSHGFDASGTTTGFVLWLNRRGIMVDPPPHSGAILKQHGIPSRLIQGVILTHCHADHDAGTFQKILEEGRIALYTTPVIKDSFLRKYCAISGLEISFLEKLFEYHEVMIGEKISVYGGKLQFFYSFHSIPCVGFAAFSKGKSMVYSADTFNDPEGIQKVYDAGVISKGRRDQLINFPWHHDVILHEAGVPPIHTPIKTLLALPDNVKERLYVVHVAPKDIPPDSGLKSAKVGPENTIVISNERSRDFRALEVLELVTSIEIFADFPISRSIEILNCARQVHYRANTVLIEQGTPGDKMYIVAMGIVSVNVNGVLVKTLTVGDHFGEMSIVTRKERTATIRALTEVELIEFTGNEFLHLLRGTRAEERLIHLGKMQRETSWQTMCVNDVLGKLSSTQKTHLQSLLNRREAEGGDVLWGVGDRARFAILVEEGEFIFAKAAGQAPFRRGAFVGDIQAILNNQTLNTTLVCVEKGAFYFIKRKDLIKFFEDNPGMFIFFKDRRFVE